MSAQSEDASSIESIDDGRSPIRSTSESGRVRWVRIAAGTLGAVSLMIGYRRRSIGGTALSLAGWWLLYWGLIGHGTRSEAFETSTETRGEREAGTPADGVTVTRTITVGKPADELYRDWRESDTLSRVAGNLARVSAVSEDRHHWIVDGPLGRNLAWDTRIVEDRPGEFLRWESLEGADLPNEGSVQFRPAPSDRGTEVTLRFRFDPPGGTLGNVVVNRLDIVPRTLASTILHRFKSLAETGEIPTLEHNPSARGSGDLL